jgi:hypothetical protein
MAAVTITSSDIQVGNRRLGGLQVVRLQPESVAEAVSRARANKLDDVFFRAGVDTYVASGRGIDAAAVRSGLEIRYGTQVGRIVHVDQQTTKTWQHMGASAFLFGLFGALCGATSAKGAAIGALVAAAIGALVGYGGSKRESQDARYDFMAQFAAK